jgi:hypothetical protein
MKNIKIILPEDKSSEHVSGKPIAGHNERLFFGLAVLCVILTVICCNLFACICGFTNDGIANLSSYVPSITYSITNIIRWGHMPWTLCLLLFLGRRAIPETIFMVFVVTLGFSMLLAMAVVISGVPLPFMPSFL